MRKILIIGLLAFMIGCSTRDEAKAPFIGEWRADWKTDPSGYGELAGALVFEMNGSFVFNEDSLTVTVNGFDNCIFNQDTIAHTQTWLVSSDTLELRNNPEEIGIQYKILSQTETKVELQLLDDIFVTLTK